MRELEMELRIKITFLVIVILLRGYPLNASKITSNPLNLKDIGYF